VFYFGDVTRECVLFFIQALFVFLKFIPFGVAL